MIQLEEVRKEYGGWAARARGRVVRALDGISLEVPPGTALGIVGPNGAGKSTLIRLLLGYLEPSGGALRVAGMEPRAYVAARGVAYVPETVAIPPAWTVRHALRFYAALGDVEDALPTVEAAAGRVGLAEVLGRRIGALSKGMLQRAALAQALLGARELMVLDEPTTGLDPEWIAELRGIVAEWRAADARRVVLIASHDLDELERTTDRVAVLEGGRLREVIDLRAPAAAFPAYRLEIAPGAGADEIVRACFPSAVSPAGEPFAYRITPLDLESLNWCMAELLRRGVEVRALAPERETLEDRFRAGRDQGGPRGDA